MGDKGVAIEVGWFQEKPAVMMKVSPGPGGGIEAAVAFTPAGAIEAGQALIKAGEEAARLQTGSEGVH